MTVCVQTVTGAHRDRDTMTTSRQGAVAVWLCLLLAASRTVAVEVSSSPDEHDEQEMQDAQEQDQVAILKQINRHNDDGSYTFGYEAADGSFKIETRDVLGNVKGMFGFIDEDGNLKRVSYSASNKTGFQSTDGKPGGVTPPPTPPLLYQQIIRPGGTTTRRPALRQYGLRLHETDKTLDPTTRKPSEDDHQDDNSDESEEPEVTTRPAVIQSIPRVRKPQGVTTTTENSEEPTSRRPHVIVGNYLRHNPLIQPLKVVNANGQQDSVPLTAPRLSAATFGQYIRPLQPISRPTTRPDLRKLVYVTRKPVAVTEDPESSTEEPETLVLHDKNLSKKDDTRRAPKGNALRRQLGDDRLLPFLRPGFRYRPTGPDETGDVYGGAAGGSERPVPDTPFRGLFTSQPRIVQNALLQGYGTPGSRFIPGPGFQLADLGDTRNVPGIRIPVGSGTGQYALGPAPQNGSPYADSGALPQDLQQQLQQLILSQQPPRYRPQPPVPALTPFQQALMQTLLGGELPPEILQQLFRPSGPPGGYPQPLPYNPQQGGYPQEQYPYPQQPVGYNPQQPVSYNPQQPVAYNPQQPPYPPLSQGQGPYGPPQPVPYPPPQASYNPQQPAPPQQMVPYPQPQPVPRPTQPVPYPPQQGPQYVPSQSPYNQPVPYDTQQYQPVQFPGQPGAYPYDDPQNSYPAQRRFRYRPRPGYITPPPYYPQSSPFNLRIPIPVYPYDSPQIQYQSPGGGRVGSPQQLMPEEYRDALLLRMLLAIRGDQERAQQSRPVYRVTEPTPTGPPTLRPSTRAPHRSVQILDPVTEEPTSKRSTNSTASA